MLAWTSTEKETLVWACAAQLAPLMSSSHKLPNVYCVYTQAGAVINVEGTRDGRLAFSGGQDGRILAHDLR